MTDQPNKACSGRRKFKTRKYADLILRSVSNQPENMETYRCPECEEFHIQKRGDSLTGRNRER